jgi:hypothetical protein
VRGIATYHFHFCCTERYMEKVRANLVWLQSFERDLRRIAEFEELGGQLRTDPFILMLKEDISVIPIL